MIKTAKHLFAFVACLSLFQNSSAIELSDLSRQYHKDEYSQIPLGEKNVALFESASSLPLSRGVVIILVEPGQRGLSFVSARQLALFLNSKGWRSLIQYAETGSNVPTSDSAIETTEDTFTLSPKDDQSTQDLNYQATETALTQQINALYKYAQQYSGYTYIVSEGISAAILMSLFNSGKLSSPDTLVSIAPYWPQREKNREVITNMSSSSYPLLDIVISNKNQWHNQTENARKNAAHAALKMYYRQRKINATESIHSVAQRMDRVPPDVRWLGNEIYSWTSHLGW